MGADAGRRIFLFVGSTRTSIRESIHPVVLTIGVIDSNTVDLLVGVDNRLATRTPPSIAHLPPRGAEADWRSPRQYHCRTWSR